MIVLDTHAWLWWMRDQARFGKKARHLIDQSMHNGQARVSVISVWEVALKSAAGKLKLPMDFDLWWDAARNCPGITFVPIDSPDAIASVQLPDSVPRDPADRLIVALAARLGATLVTLDKRLIDCGIVPTSF